MLSAHSALAQRALLGTLWGAGPVGLLLVLAIYHFSIAYERREERASLFCIALSDFGIASRCGDAAHRAYQRECDAGGLYLARPHRIFHDALRGGGGAAFPC